MRADDADDTRQELEALRKYYDETYYAEGKTGHDIYAGWYLRGLLRRLGLRPGQDLLDVACGRGEWLAAAARAGVRTYGTDISTAAIALARRADSASEYRVAPAERLPFPDTYFDCVTCLGSLEHFAAPVAAVREMGRVIRPGGRVVILVPNAGFLTRRLGLYGGTWQTAVREDVRSIGAWEGIFAEAGLTVDTRWRDLHVLSTGWIFRGSPLAWGLRAMQAAALPLWPLAWQYQVFFCLRKI